ncbi:MAG TPA: filamentous hemagglutinin family protein [Methylibium sp.]|nr:filamentous hemagglutinin family protein [Methylibium sp.]
MKRRLARPATARLPRPCYSSSLRVLAALGALSCSLPAAAQAGAALPAGTLPVLRGVVSGQVTVNAPVRGAGRSLMTIDQGSQRAIIDWRSFNIAADGEVRFNQPGSTASALNRIYGADPSVIQGRLSANGQVLLINQNGVLFHRGAQVNTQSLVVSTLNMSNARFDSGALTTGGLSTPAFEGGYDDAGNTLAARPDGSLPGAIVLGGGNAAAAAPTLAAHAGGSIVLLAPRVENRNALITAPDGQVILAAGGKVYLALPNEDDTVLRGMRVEVEAAGDAVNLSDLVRNAGTLSADRGNVTLAALAINQDGRVSANTAVQANGSIYLQARTLGGQQAGSASFGAGSLTQVLPDAADKATLPDSESYVSRRGVIQVEGRTIVSQGALEAAGGRIVLDARDAADPSGARVYLDAGSSTSVAGQFTDVALDKNLLSFTVTSNELKDSPDQKSGVLRGATVTVDLRKSNPTLDLSGYRAAQARTVAEKAAEGGELQINSTGAVIQRSGATLDASGGGYRYADGNVATTKLLGDDGKVYDIGSAPKDRTYTALVDNFSRTDARWNQTTRYSGLMYGLGQQEAGYVEGKAGGSIAINSAAGLVLDGALKGGVTVGPNQLDKAPRAATLAIGALNREGNDFAEGQRIGNIRFTGQAGDTLGAGFTAGSVLSEAQREQLTLASAQLFGASTSPTANTLAQAAFGTVELNSNGRIVLDEAVHLSGAPGSSLLLRAPEIDIAGAIDMPAGRITLQPLATAEPIGADPGLGTTLRSGARLSTAGVWINNASADGAFVGAPLPSARRDVGADGSVSATSMLNGGRITIMAPENSTTRLEDGASLDVGGGAAIDRNRRLTAGNGGTLSIANAVSEQQTSDWLRADLSGFAAGSGGSLEITTPRAVIDPADANGTLPANTTRLLPSLFSDFGFANVQVRTSEGLVVSAGSSVTVEQRSRVIDALAAPGLATGGDLASISRLERLPDHLRPAASVTLSSSSNNGTGTLLMEAGSAIVTDPKGRVTLQASDALRVDGRISAPGGSVTARLSGPVNTLTPDLALGATAEISVAGGFVPRPDSNGLDLGTVFDAGTISLEATNAGVALAAGSRLDLDGVTRRIDYADPSSASGASQRQVDGHAGTLVVKSQGMATLDGSITARRGSAQGAGGSFALELNAPGGQTVLPDERRIVVGATGPAVPEAGFVDARVDTAALQAAGFDKLRLQSENRIAFEGDANLAFERGVRLDAPLLDVRNDAQVALSGATVSLGQSLGPRQLQGETYELAPRAASPVLDTRAGGGTLSVQAGTIDLYGSQTLNGVAETRLYADGDVRLTGRNVELVSGGAAGAQVGSLSTAGNVVIRAAQLYPSTRSDFTITVADQPGGTPVAGGAIVIASNGQPAGDVYSAGGRLSLQADTIFQGGVVKAPLGAIELRAGSLLDLAEGSLTSVSADGLTVPLGTTSAGVTWTYVDGPGSTSTLTAPSAQAKRIELAGQRVDVRAGAVVDLSGGGEVQAIEFVPGSGGSKDTLLQPNTYAIIPKALLSSMPVDTDIASRQDIGFGLQTANPDASVYDSLTIGSGAAVPAGEYMLLPGRYALLPGAFLVQLQTGSAYANLQPGQSVQLANGQTVVAAHRSVAGTAIRESNAVGVLLRPGSDARRESDYTLSDSGFFADAATRDRTPLPRLPIDAGRLAIVDVAALTLKGRFDTAPGSASTASGTTVGRGAEVDLSAERIAIVDRVGRGDIDPAFLQVEAQGLSSLGASVLVGGQRGDSGGTTQISTGAREVLVANDAASELKVPELMLAATETVTVRAGSVLAGEGDATGATGGVLATGSSGALLRLSSGGQAVVDRGSAPDASVGTVRIEAGASLRADGSILLDATRSTQSQGSLAIGDGQGGALSLASSQVSLGQTDGVAGVDGGLVLSNAALAGLAGLDELTIKGYQGIDLYGNAVVGGAQAATVTLDTAAIRGNAVDGAAAARITAREVRLVNRDATTAPDAAARGGSLAIDAERVVIGAGAKSLSGFDAVSIAASREIVGQGSGSLQVDADWRLSAPRVGVAAGADQTWRAADAGGAHHHALTLARPDGGSTPADGSEAGGRLRLEGRSVEIATTVQARSGTIAVAARGTGGGDGITLADGAVLDVRGMRKDYHGKAIVAGAGRVELSSAGGAVALAAGSRVDARGVAGGDAGSLAIAAPTLELGGTLDARAEAGGRGGRFALDVGALQDFGALNGALEAGGFDEARAIRLRSGDLRIGAGDVVRARELSLAADAGRIDIAGTLDARSARGGGTIEAWAADGLALSGARLLAGGTGTGAAPSDGGQVRLGTGAGTLSFDAASTIDVSPGGQGHTGSVAFTVARDANGVVAPTALQGRVVGVRDGRGGAAEVAVEARRVYDAAGNIGAADIAGYASEHAAFIGAVDAASLIGGLQGDVNASVRGATELRSAGDLTLAEGWDLTTAQWLAGARPGTLTLRAAGNLTLTNALGLPDDALPAGATWSLGLVGGADLSAANPLAVQALAAVAPSGSGNVTLSGDLAKVRTGTGSIRIAAAADFRMDSPRSVVYTSGRIGAADAEASGNNRWSRDGGSISIEAGRDAIGSSDEWITEWLRRPRTTPTGVAYADWWVYRPNFQQGVGTLGGGDIRIGAGRDVDGLSAMLPTTGRHEAVDGVPTLDVQGGGDLRVEAGSDIRGGAYLVARGDGRLSAGGAVGADRPTQLYLQGLSSGVLPEQATIGIEAGGGVTLQSVNNPTAVYMNNSTGIGPSFAGTATSIPTFFSYSANSRVDVTAMSGDIVLGTELADARTLVPTQAVSVGQRLVTGAYPASLQAAAFDGDIAVYSEGNAGLVTYPSPTASVALLAQGSLHDAAITASDLAPAAVTGADAPSRFTRQLTGSQLLPSGAQPRIVERSVDGDYAFDLQALTGDIDATGANAVPIDLPARSRLRAGRDIVDVALTLQNLDAGDLSVVRADGGDVRPAALEVRGPGRLLVQAGRDIDLGQSTVFRGGFNLGGLIATGNTANPALADERSARLTLLAGVHGDVDLAKLDASYEAIIGLNGKSSEILALFRTLNGDPDRERVLAAADLQTLAVADPSYTPFVELATKYPQLLATYQATLRSGALPLGASAEAAQAAELYALLNRETNSQAIVKAASVAELVNGSAGGAAYARYAALDARYPRVFADYRARRSRGALPEGLTPILFSDVLAGVIGTAIPASAVGSGGISSYLSSIQTYGGSDVDLWAPNGNIVVGLTTPAADRTVGVVTNAGGAIRSVLGGDFSINQGKVLTAQGGDILIFSSGASIDAGRGARTSISTPPPKRTPIFSTPEDGSEPVIIGYQYTLPASASGSGIQTLSSDPDGLGPRTAPAAGSIYLFAPAGTIDAGEAGIRSGGNIVINAQTVLNASNISSSGSSVGVPVAQSGSLASSLASSGSTTTANAAEDAGKAAADAARASAAAEGLAKPSILTVEVLGFGERNCKEQEKDCFAK